MVGEACTFIMLFQTKGLPEVSPYTDVMTNLSVDIFQDIYPLQIHCFTHGPTQTWIRTAGSFGEPSSEGPDPPSKTVTIRGACQGLHLRGGLVS